MFRSWHPRVATPFGRAAGVALVVALVAAVTPAGAVPAPPRVDFPAYRTHALTLDFDGTQLPGRIVATSVDFAAPEFVEAVYSTEIHPFFVEHAYQPGFWTGEVVFAEDAVAGATGELLIEITGLLDNKPIAFYKSVPIRVADGPIESTVRLGSVFSGPQARAPRTPDAASPQLDRLLNESIVTLYPSVPGLEVDFGTGLQPTEIRTDEGRLISRHITRELDPEHGMLPAVVTMTFERDGRIEPVTITALITSSPPPDSTTTVPVYHYDVTQSDGVESWSYRIDLSYDENTGILESWIIAGNVQEMGIYDTLSGQWIQPFPDDLDDRLFFQADAPLLGMDPGYLHQYQGDATNLLPANPDSVYATEVQIEGNVGNLAGGTPTVAERDGAPSGKHPNLACAAACFACGATLFMGPTCTQWVDCIDWAENPRAAQPADPVATQ